MLAWRGVVLPGTLCSATTHPHPSQRAHLCHAHVPTATPAASAGALTQGWAHSGPQVKTLGQCPAPEGHGHVVVGFSEPGCVSLGSANSTVVLKVHMSQVTKLGQHGHLYHDQPVDVLVLLTMLAARFSSRRVCHENRAAALPGGSGPHPGACLV